MRLLLISNGHDPDRSLLAHAAEPVSEFTDDAERVVFAPFAAVTTSGNGYVRYTDRLAEALGRPIIGLHDVDDPVGAVRSADVVMVGGGNTWHLLRELRRRDLLPAIRDVVRSGVPYIGWSAGSNVACPEIATTNDMPIVDPGGIDALGLVPFQINPHYTDAHVEGHQGETREQRIAEFLRVHPGGTVVGLREGSWLRTRRGRVELDGRTACRLFTNRDGTFGATEIEPGGDLSELDALVTERPHS